MQLPTYKCFKTVQAMKIKKITSDRLLNAVLIGEEGEVFVSDEWFKKHNPQVGGYFVLYKDGYRSYSPAEAFEEGYLLEDQAERDKQRLDPSVLGVMASELIELLDRIEVSFDPTLAKERFDIAGKHGFEIVFHPIDSTRVQ